MNRKLIEALYREKFELEDKMAAAEENTNFVSSCPNCDPSEYVRHVTAKHERTSRLAAVKLFLNLAFDEAAR